MRIVYIYLSLYQSIMQYRMIIWCGESKNILNPLDIKNTSIQQDNIILISLKEDNLIGPTFCPFQTI